MEYAGYIPVEGMDISGLTDKIANKVFTIGEERKKKKAELEDQFQAGLTKASSMDMTESATINDKIADVSEQYKESIYQLHKKMISGQISPSEFTRYTQTAKDNIDTFQKYANTLDARIKTQAERIAKGEAGALQGHQMALLEDAVKLGNKYRVDENGRIVVDILDESGNVTRTTNVDFLNKPGVLTSNKIDANAKVDDIMKNWDAQGMYERLARDGSVTWESIRANSAYKTARKTAALALISGDNLQSVLLDNGALPGAIVAYSQSDAKNKISQQIAMESEVLGRKLTNEEISEIQDKIIMLDENGKAVISDKQREMAIKAIEDMIDIRAAEKTKLNVEKGHAPQKTSSSDVKAAEELGSSVEGFKAISKAMYSDPSNPQDLRALELKAKSIGKYVKLSKVKNSDGKWVVKVQEQKPYEHSKDITWYKNNIVTKSPEFKEWKKNNPDKKTSVYLYENRTRIESEFNTWSEKDENKTEVSLKNIGEAKIIDEGKELAPFVYGGDADKAYFDYQKGKNEASDYNTMLKEYYDYYWNEKNNKRKPKISLGEWEAGSRPSGTTTGTTTSGVTAGSPI